MLVLTLGSVARSSRRLQARQLSVFHFLAKPPSQESSLPAQKTNQHQHRLVELKPTSLSLVRPIFYCNNCDRVFKSKGALTRHSRQCAGQTDRTHHSVQQLTEPDRPPPASKVHLCGKCGKQYKSAGGRNKHERKCTETLPLQTQTETTTTESNESLEISSAFEKEFATKNWYQKADELNETPGIRQGILESYFDLMVNTDLLVNRESNIEEAFEEFTLLKSNPNVKVNLNTITNFNTFLRGFAREGDFKHIQKLWREMIELRIKPDLSSYISIFLSFHASDPTNPVYHKVFNALYADFEKAGYSLDIALHHGDFLLEDKKRFLRTISVFRNLDLSSYVPIQNGNNSPLVQKLRTEDSSLLSSQVEGLVTGEDLRAALGNQLKLESQLLVSIPSLYRTESSELLKSFTDRLLNEWRKTIEGELQTKIYRRSILPIWEVGSSVRYNNFLSFLPSETLREIILAKAVKILTCDGFSEPLAFIRADLGDSVMKAYHMFVKTDPQAFGDYSEGVKRYYDWYCDPKASRSANSIYFFSISFISQGKDPTHRDAVTKQLWNVSIDTKMKKWPKSLRLTLGNELLKIMFYSCKLDKLVSERSDHVVLDGKYLTCNNMVWSERETSEETAKHPAFFKIFRKRKGNFDVEEVKPNPALFELFSASSLSDLTFPPEDLPMLVPPLPWVSSSTGGYIMKDSPLIKYPDIGINDHEKLIDDLEPGGLNPVLDSLNQLGSVAWRVNKPILDLAIQLFNDPQPDESLLYELDIPIHKDLIKGEPQLSEDIKACQREGVGLSETQKLEFRNFHNARQMHAKLKEEKHSLWCSALYRLSLAKHFQDSVLWFPHNVDFRGRCYPIPSQLNHMGSDLPRSLLVFAKGKKLGSNGFYWLKLHCINLTGTMKKESIHKRIEYVETIMDKILDSARDPLNGDRWWLESDDPWQTLSACMEIRNAMEHPGGPADYTCHLPIHQDGSCNGLQHYAALGRDRLGAEAVNLVPAQKPGDVYSLIANIVDNKREADSREGNKLARVLEGHIKRKVVKQTVMTTVYGVTKYGAKLQIKKQLKDIREFPLDCVDDASKYVAAKTFDSLNEVFESSQRIQSWLTECAGVISKDCKSQVSWVTPLGFPVVQPYYKVTFPSSVAKVTNIYNLEVKE